MSRRRSLLGLGMGLVAGAVLPSAADALPAWARKYNMNCSGCHYPAPPRLNSMGQQFRWAGYRMPNEIGQPVAVEQVSNYIAMRGRARYEDVRQKVRDTVRIESGFSFHDATLFYGGPFLTSYSGWFEIEREAADEVDITTHFQSVWGSSNSYWGLRGGQMHWLYSEGLAGFDRTTGVSRPSAFADRTTAGSGRVPFRIRSNQLGLEAYYVAGRNRISAQVLNGITASGAGDEGDTEDAAKDFVLTASRILDDVASGVTAMAYYGTLGRYTPRHFLRVAASANKVFSDNEVMAGVTYSRDTDLPSDTAITGQAFFVQLGRYFRSNDLTLFGRYDFLDPNTDVDENAYSVVTLGLVRPVGNPQYLRFALEGSLQSWQDPAIKSRTKLLAEVMLNF